MLEELTNNSSHCSSKVCVYCKLKAKKKKKNNTIKSNGKNLTEIVKSERDKEIQKCERPQIKS